jgi:hypothetical protein
METIEPPLDASMLKLAGHQHSLNFFALDLSETEKTLKHIHHMNVPKGRLQIA